MLRHPVVGSHDRLLLVSFSDSPSGGQGQAQGKNGQPLSRTQQKKESDERVKNMLEKGIVFAGRLYK